MVYTTEEIIAAEKCLYEVRKLANKSYQKSYYIKNAEKIKKCSSKYYEKTKEQKKQERKEARKLASDTRNRHFLKITVIDTKINERFEYDNLQECANDMGFTPYRIYKNLKDRVAFKGYMFEKG